MIGVADFQWVFWWCLDFVFTMLTLGDVFATFRSLSSRKQLYTRIHAPNWFLSLLALQENRDIGYSVAI